MHTKTYQLDVEPGGIPIVVHVSQYDSATQLVFQLYSRSGTLAIPSTGVTALIHGTKRDGNGISLECSYELVGSTPTVSVTTTKQMTAIAGKNVFELLVQTATEDLYTANFILQVERTALDYDTVTSESRIKEIMDVIERADDLITAAEEIEELATGELVDRVTALEQTVASAGATLLDILRSAAYVTSSAGILIDALDYDINHGDAPVYYSVTNSLTHVETNNAAIHVAALGTYMATLSPAENYALGSVTVTMGGEDITSTVYSEGNIVILTVTGPIVVTASGVYQGEVIYSLTDSDFTYGVGNNNSSPYYNNNTARASYTAFDLLLDPGATYSFTFTSTAGNGYFGTQFFNTLVVTNVERGTAFSNDDQYDPGWHAEGETYTYTVGTVNSRQIVGVRLAVRNNANNALSSGYITSLVIRKESE